jgi:hypothetical protein
VIQAPFLAQGIGGRAAFALLLAGCGGAIDSRHADRFDAGGTVVSDASGADDGPAIADATAPDTGSTEPGFMDAASPANSDAADVPDASDTAPADGSAPDAHWIDSCGHSRPDVFADEVISFAPGSGAGFGQSQMPCIVLGPPVGGGTTYGSTDVVSLGDQGSIVLAFDDVTLVDGPGPDLLVFENALPGFVEPGFVAVSDDGQSWHEWPCAPQDADGGYPGCAGIHPTLSSPSNGISATDPAVAGGDAFDLADLGVTSARYVRVRDSGFSHYGGTTGGFDLDAIAAVNSASR